MTRLNLQHSRLEMLPDLSARSKSSRRSSYPFRRRWECSPLSAARLPEHECKIESRRCRENCSTCAHRLCSWKYLIQEQYGEEASGCTILTLPRHSRDGGLTKPHQRRGKNRTKREDFCRDCGSMKHNRGDESCENPSYMTIRIRER